MNRDEIDDVIELSIAQPEFPDVGIGHGDTDLRLDRADRVGEIGYSYVLAQQRLVSDHERDHGLGIFPGEAYRRRNLRLVLLLVLVEENALDDLQPRSGRKFGDLVETKIVRIGTDAVGYLRQLSKILRDLLTRYLRRRRKRRLMVAEWSV